MPEDHSTGQERIEHVEVTQAPGQEQDAALQVICLGSGGGPSEDNVTGFLVRSLSSGWSKGSLLAVDAGSHLAAITRCLEKSFPLFSNEIAGERQSTPSPAPSDLQHGVKKKKHVTILDSGPFAGVKFPHLCARANALHVLHTYVSTYLITHPHLDHLSGFTINTAALHGRSRPKTLAALPNTVDAVKRHIFNDIIWPNLSDEDGGVGFVTFQRLKEGGDSMIGEGDGRGYIDVCDGLGAKAFSISHGLCTKSPPAHQLRGSISNAADLAASHNGATMPDGNHAGQMSGSMSNNDHGSVPSTPGAHRRQSLHNLLQTHSHPPEPCVVESTAYFIRDEETAREVLIFGDVEPDSISMSPRNEIVWTEAAHKVANGSLKGILIECSYTDAASDEALFGHLCPRHVVAELQVLAQLVHEVKTGQRDDNLKKRKHSALSSADSRSTSSYDDGRKRGRSVHSAEHHGSATLKHYADSQPRATPEATSPKDVAARHISAVPVQALSVNTHTSKASSGTSVPSSELPLQGLTVVIMHVKDTFKDGPPVSDTIARELQEHEEYASSEGQALGCKFVISAPGESYWF